ncbi:hypothetical protein EV182_002431, partial [Spiromyces aspiralis]
MIAVIVNVRSHDRKPRRRVGACWPALAAAIRAIALVAILVVSSPVATIAASLLIRGVPSDAQWSLDASRYHSGAGVPPDNENNSAAERFVVEFTSEPGTTSAASDVERLRAFLRSRNIHTDYPSFQTLISGMSVEADHGLMRQIEALDFVKRTWPILHHHVSNSGAAATAQYAEVAKNGRVGPRSISRPDFTDSGDDGNGNDDSHTYLSTQDVHKVTGVEKLHSELGLLGNGVKVGVIDTGIDYTHPELGGCWKTPGCPIQFGYDFVGNQYDGTNERQPSDDPFDECAGHGTHVSGIIIGRGPYVYGVAPNVTLGVYKVNNCLKRTVSDEVMVEAMERAFRDGMDVVNLSLAGPGWKESVMAVAAANLVKKGVVVVASCGNSGQGGLHTSGDPAQGQDVINVGSYESPYTVGRNLLIQAGGDTREIAHFIGSSFLPLNITHPLSLVLATNATRESESDHSDVDGRYVGCDPFPPGSDVAGRIVYANRGGCTFIQKARVAQDAGAAGIIVGNNAAGRVMPQLDETVTIPLTVVLQADGRYIEGALAANKPVVVTGADTGYVAIPNEPYAGAVSNFSSWGPDPELYLEPDIMAPGGEIFSTFPVIQGGYLTLSGTSMSSPYVAGVMALLVEHSKRRGGRISHRLAHDAVLLHARPVLSMHADDYLLTPLRQGHGYIDAYAAATSSLAVSPPELSLNYTLNGQPVARKLTVRNLDGGRARRLQVSHLPAESVSSYLPGGEFTVVPTVDVAGIPTVEFGNTGEGSMVIELPPGGSHTFAVTVTPPSHLTEDGGWYFGGYIEFSDITEGPDAAGPPMSVPYMGYKGNYTDISVFVPHNPADRDVVSVVNSGTPVLTYMGEATEVVEGKSYELTQEKSIYLSFSVLRPSRILTVKLVDEDSGEAVGYLPYGYN